MIQLALHILITAGLLFVIGRMVSGIEVRDGATALFGAIGLGLANAFIRPLLLKLALPITIVTFGLFIWVINAFMLMLVAAFIDGFEVKGFRSALAGSALLGLFNLAISLLFGLF